VAANVPELEKDLAPFPLHCCTEHLACACAKNSPTHGVPPGITAPHLS
jgi:hypothetical protein